MDLATFGFVCFDRRHHERMLEGAVRCASRTHRSPMCGDRPSDLLWRKTVRASFDERPNHSDTFFASDSFFQLRADVADLRIVNSRLASTTSGISASAFFQIWRNRSYAARASATWPFRW